MSVVSLYMNADGFIWKNPPLIVCRGVFGFEAHLVSFGLVWVRREGSSTRKSSVTELERERESSDWTVQGNLYERTFARGTAGVHSAVLIQDAVNKRKMKYTTMFAAWIIRMTCSHATRGCYAKCAIRFGIPLIVSLIEWPAFWTIWMKRKGQLRVFSVWSCVVIFTDDSLRTAQCGMLFNVVH